MKFLFKMSEKEPMILVLDEYPYLRENSKGLDSVLQSVIDYYKDTSNMKLIVCGSYVDTMKALLEKQNPLYGRIDLTLNLKPMDYYESALFYYKYIFRNMSRMNIMDPDIFYDKYISDDFETKYVPKSFERICKQYLIRKNRKGLLDEVFEKIGKYYYDDPVEKRMENLTLLPWMTRDIYFMKQSLEKTL